MVVESRSVIRKAKNARGLGRDRAAAASPIFPAATAPFPKSCASYFRFARFNTFPLYYLRAWHRLCRNGMIVRYTYSWEGDFCDSAQKEVILVNNWCGNLHVAPIRRRSLHEWNPALRTPAWYGHPDNVVTMAYPFGPILTGFQCTLLPWFPTRVRAPVHYNIIVL